MPVETELREDGQVSYFKVTDPWTMEDLLKGFGQANANRDALRNQNPNSRVHTLLDLTGAKTAPPGVLRGRKFPGLTHSTRGEIVVAVADEYPRSITRAMLQVMRAEGHFFETLDEAWAYLRAVIQKPLPNVDAENESA